MNIGWVIFGLAIAVVLLTSVFKTIDLNTKVKALISVVLSVAAAAVTVWVAQDGDFTTSNIVEVVSLVYASSQLIYNFILKGTSLDQRLESVTIFGGSDTPPSNGE